jgi:hypothetical protein
MVVPDEAGQFLGQAESRAAQTELLFACREPEVPFEEACAGEPFGDRLRAAKQAAVALCPRTRHME